VRVRPFLFLGFADGWDFARRRVHFLFNSQRLFVLTPSQKAVPAHTVKRHRGPCAHGIRASCTSKGRPAPLKAPSLWHYLSGRFTLYKVKRGVPPQTNLDCTSALQGCRVYPSRGYLVPELQEYFPAGENNPKNNAAVRQRRKGDLAPRKGFGFLSFFYGV